jgi:hypothetical protein
VFRLYGCATAADSHSTFSAQSASGVQRRAKPSAGQENQSVGVNKKIPAAVAVGIVCINTDGLGQCRSFSGFGSLNELDESGFVIDGDFGKHFAVQGDFRFDQTFNEAAVADVIGFASGVDAHGPKAAKVALFLFAMNKGHRLCTVDRFGRHTEKFAAVTVETFSEI